MLSMRTMVDKEALKALTGTIGFETGGESFVGRLENGTLPIERGDTAGADTVFRATTPMELAAPATAHRQTRPASAGAVRSPIPVR